MIELILMLLLTTSDPSPVDEEAGAKTMFDNPTLNTRYFSPTERDKPSAKAATTRQPPARAPVVRSLGVSHWIRQVDAQGRSLGKVASSKVFHNGDRIQLVVKSNDDGYLAVIQQKVDGQAGLLYPSETELGKIRIEAHSENVLPGPGHSFTFDKSSGEIRLLLVLTRTLEELVPLRLSSSMDRSALENLRRLAIRERGAKNLVIEAFSDPLEDPATYTVNRAGGAVIQEIELVHEP